MPSTTVTDHGLAADAALLGWILATFSLAAALGAVTGRALTRRFAYARWRPQHHGIIDELAGIGNPRPATAALIVEA